MFHMCTSCLNKGPSSTSHCHPNLACCVLPQNLPQLDFWEFPYHQVERNTTTILSGPTSRNPANLSKVSLGQTIGPPLPIHWLRNVSVEVPAGNETETWGSDVMHEVQFSTNDQRYVGQEIRLVVFQESFVIPSCYSVWKCVGSL
jgi:hypothetical protein